MFPSSPVNTTNTSTPYLGQIVAVAENLPSPNGWALCDGQLLQINQNQALFAILGTTYGGDGIHTFALPNLEGRTVLGAGNGNLVGTVDPSNTTSLVGANIPAVTVSVATFLANETSLGQAPAGFSIADKAQAIHDNLDALAAFSANMIGITVTDANPVVVNNATFVADKAALDKIVGGFSLLDDASALNGDLAGLEADVAHINSLSTLTGSITANILQFGADAALLDKTVGGFVIADLASNVSGQFDALNADPHVASISLTDSGIPALTLTASQAANDTSALSKISNPIFEIVTASTAVYYVKSGSGYSILASGSTVNASAGTGFSIGGNGLTGASNLVVGSNVSVTLLSGSRTDVDGSGNAISSAGGSVYGVGGWNNTVTAGPGDTVWIGGDNVGADLVVGSGAVVMLLSNSLTNIDGSRNAITSFGGSAYGVGGASNTVNAGANDSIWIGGASDLIVGSGDAITLLASSVANNVNGSNDVITSIGGSSYGVGGSNNTITAGAGDSIWLAGTGNFIAGSSDTITLLANSVTNDIHGSNDVVTSMGGSSFGVRGSSNTITAGSGDSIWIGGDHNVINASTGDTIYDLAAATDIKVSGAVGAMTVNNFGADPSGFVDLLNGVGGFANAAAAVAALTSDTHGGSLLSLGANGSIDFAGVAANQLSAANFQIG
ncbi:MAG: tail fiber protein [Hyphomicrobiales bacterium]|nr:tail fiber protein [Hyphomicrobiales bacterium]